MVSRPQKTPLQKRIGRLRHVAGEVRRKGAIASYVQRRGPVTAAEVGAAKGLDAHSADATLAILEHEGRVVQDEAGRFTWVGGEMLIPWRELGVMRQRILAALARLDRAASTIDISEAATARNDEVTSALEMLAEWGWCTKSIGRHGSRRVVIAEITDAGRAAYAAALATMARDSSTEISTERVLTAT